MRLIDVDALRKNSKMLYSIHAFEPVEGYTQDQLDAVPSIDAVPVVHGRWEDVPQSDVPAHMCSECGKVRYGLRVLPYCPHCGARMDASDGGGV